MPSSLYADPLLVALFDIPAEVQVPGSKSRRHRRRRLCQQDGDGGDTDTSLLHGESISLSDEDEVASVSPPQIAPKNMVSLPARLPAFTTLDVARGRHPVPLPAENNNHVMGQKKKKKKGSGAMKSLKKLMGRTSKSSSNALIMSSYDDEGDSDFSSPTTDASSYKGDNEQSPNTLPNVLVDGSLSLDRLSHLKKNIGRIRATVQSLEGDLIATRNELAKAHHQLHLATVELTDVQRSALEADVGVSKLVQQHGGMYISTSSSALRLSPLHFYEADMRSSTRSTSPYYFTPNSSVGSGEDDYLTARSRTSSYGSFLNEKGTSTPIRDGTANKKSSLDKDMTPLTRNGNPKDRKERRRFKFDSGVEVSNKVSEKESTKERPNSIDTPSTVASSHAEKETEDEQRERSRVTFFKQQSYIRAHDLAIDTASDNSALLPLHEIEVSNVVNALFAKGQELALDETDRWTPESSTGKILRNREKKLADGEIDGPIGQWPNAAYGDEVLVWTSKCTHGGHGSEYPMVRARGLIPTSARSMVDLLLDSGRTKEYNKMSLGRTDEHRFAQGVDAISASSPCSVTGIQGEAKIVRSKSQPPVVRKPVELRLLLHARKLHSESGEGARYLTIGRSVWETEHGTAEAEDTSATRCEMLLSCNLIRDVGVTGEMCEITTITHGVSPGIPISIGKRIGLAAAAKYVRDIRAVFGKEL